MPSTATILVRKEPCINPSPFGSCWKCGPCKRYEAALRPSAARRRPLAIVIPEPPDPADLLQAGEELLPGSWVDPDTGVVRDIFVTPAYPCEPVPEWEERELT